MANPIIPPILATMTLLNPLPTFPSSTSDSLSLPLSTQSASLSSQALPTSISSASSHFSSPSNSASFSSSSASLSSQVLSTTTTLTHRLTTISPIPTTSSLTTPTLSSSNFELSKRSIPIPVTWIIVITVLSLALILIIFACFKSRRILINAEAELALPPQGTPRPWSTMDVTPGLIRRTTTARLREDWQQWISKPPPLRGGLRRRDSAVLFGAGSGSSLSSEPLLTAHEVEVSGVLESEISDPPPAYTPRRV